MGVRERTAGVMAQNMREVVRAERVIVEQAALMAGLR